MKKQLKKINPKAKLSDFVGFIRQQGVVGLAVGFLLGGSISKVVSALVEDIINPILGIILGSAESLQNMKLIIGPVTLGVGHFLSVLIDFIVIAAVVYFVIKGLGFDKIDKADTKK